MRRKTWEEQRRTDQQNWYDEMHTTQVKLKLNRKTDADVLDWLWKQRYNRNTSMQGEIKRLIRAEIAREKCSKNCRCTPTKNHGISNSVI